MFGVIGKEHPMFGKHHSYESKMKISEAVRKPRGHRGKYKKNK